MLGKDITLYYFDLRARGEIIRLILHAKEQKFNDKRVQFPDWPALKPNTPFGSLPVLEVDGDKFTQNVAICTYLAQELSLNGSNPKEAAKILEIQCMREDLITAEAKARFAKDESQKAELAATLEKETYPKFLKKFNELIESNKQSVWYIGKNMTLADIVIFEGLQTFYQNHPQEVDTYPAIKKLREAVAQVPGIKKYLDGRKESPM